MLFAKIKTRKAMKLIKRSPAHVVRRCAGLEIEGAAAGEVLLFPFQTVINPIILIINIYLILNLL